MSQPAPLYVAAVDLPEESIYSTRWFTQAGMPKNLYPLLIGLSRSVNDYEIVTLSGYGFDVLVEGKYARGWALMTSNLESVPHEIQKWDTLLAVAAEKAQRAEESAQEIERRQAKLLEDINAQLKADVPDRYK